MLLVAGLFFSLFYLTSGLDRFNSDVVTLTSSNFTSLVEDSDEVWFVVFFESKCDLCEALEPEYSKAATALKEVAKFGAVNRDDEESLVERFGVKDFPTIKIFGADKSNPIDYVDARTAEAIIDSANNAVKNVNEDSFQKKSWRSSDKIFDSEHITKLSDKNFASRVYNSGDFWFVNFYKSPCSPCRAFAPELAKAARQLKGKATFGSVDVLIHRTVSSQYQTKKTPVLYFFNRKSKGKHNGVKYEGSKTASAVVSWALNMIKKNTPSPLPQPTTPKTSTTYTTTTAINTTTAPGQNVTDEHCAESPFCFITCLSHIIQCRTKNQNKYVDALRKVLEIFMSKFWEWVLLDSGGPAGLAPTPDMGQAVMSVLNQTVLKPNFSVISDNRILEFLRECIDSKYIRSLLHVKPNSFSMKYALRERETDVQSLLEDFFKRQMWTKKMDDTGF